ncbi:MAG: hypothetical protein AAF927_10630 [Bacteroidota bacterium]
MKPIIICLALCCLILNLKAQENDPFSKGEVLISLRNPTIGFLDWGSDYVTTYGSNLDLGYFIKDNYLIGAGGSYYYNRIAGNNNDAYSWGIQLFGRYYFARRGKKKQFIFYAEPRIEGIRRLTQSQPLAGNFINTRNYLNAGMGIFCAWRPNKRISVDLGIQTQIAFSNQKDPGQEVVNELGLSVPPSISINLYL